MLLKKRKTLNSFCHAHEAIDYGGQTNLASTRPPARFELRFDNATSHWCELFATDVVNWTILKLHISGPGNYSARYSHYVFA